MAHEPTVSVSDAIWVKWLGAYMQAAGRNVREALYEEWPLLMRKVMDFTPPFATQASRGPGKTFANSASDLSVGRKAVARDIFKTMRPFDPGAIRSTRLKEIVERRDVVAFNQMATHSTSPYLQDAEALPFSESIHVDRRDARGRVPGKPRNIVVLGSDADALRAYVVKVQKRVGYAKSGWLKALLLVGGDAPAYVTNKGTGGGDVIDDHANEEEPSRTAINRTPWAVRKDEAGRILSDAKASRIEAIIAKVRFAALRADAEAKGA